MSSLLPHSLSHSRCGVSARPCSALAFARPREGPAHPGHGLLAGTIPCWKPHRLLLSPCRIFLPADHTPGLEFGAGKPRARRGAVRWARLNSKGGFQGTETAARSGFPIVYFHPPFSFESLNLTKAAWTRNLCRADGEFGGDQELLWGHGSPQDLKGSSPQPMGTPWDPAPRFAWTPPSQEHPLGHSNPGGFGERGPSSRPHTP